MFAAVGMIVGALVLCASPWVGRRLLTAAGAKRPSVASTVGGASLAYLVLGLLYELAHDSGANLHRVLHTPEPLQSALGLLLVGLVGFVALQATVTSRAEAKWGYAAFGIPYGAYAFVVGAGIFDEADRGWPSEVLYVAVLAAHLAINDAYLGRLFPGRHLGRWRLALALSPLPGTLVWLWLTPSGVLREAPLALLAGPTLLQVFREELPDPREIRVGWFLTGVIVLGAMVSARWWL